MKQRQTNKSKTLRLSGLWFLGLLVFGMAAGLTACSSGDDEPQHTTADKAIGFGVGSMSRAVVTTKVNKIGVFGYSHTNNFDDDLAMRFPDYYLNQAVINKNGSWTYSGVTKYWPKEGVNLSFFAYAPYIDVEDTFMLKPQVMSDKGTPTIEYEVPENIYDQIDLLYSNSMGQTYKSNNGVVDFTMNHALTRIGFQIKISDNEKERPFIIEIKELALENVNGEGVLDMLTGEWTTTRPADNSGWAKYSLTPAYGSGLKELVLDTRNTTSEAGKPDPFSYTDIFMDGHYLMLIPQEIDDKYDGLSPAQVVVKYSVTNVYNNETEDMEKTVALSRPALKKWRPGQGITYQLELSVFDGIAVEFDIEGFIAGTPWEDGNGGGSIEGGVS